MSPPRADYLLPFGQGARGFITDITFVLVSEPSRYTFKEVSLYAWHGIVFLKKEFHRFHPIKTLMCQRLRFVLDILKLCIQTC